MNLPSEKQVLEYALEVAEDFKPKSSVNDEDIELIWFTKAQIDRVIRYAQTGKRENDLFN